jgi:hypothetical protein
MVWIHTHDNDNWDTELFKLTEQTSRGKFMFYNICSSGDLIIITEIAAYSDSLWNAVATIIMIMLQNFGEHIAMQ